MIGWLLMPAVANNHVARAIGAYKRAHKPSMSNLKQLLAEQHALTQRVNEAIKTAFPVGARVEFTVFKRQVRTRETGEVFGYCHRWRLDLRIRSDVDGKAVTKVVSHMNANETTIIPS